LKKRSKKPRSVASAFAKQSIFSAWTKKTGLLRKGSQRCAVFLLLFVHKKKILSFLFLALATHASAAASDQPSASESDANAQLQAQLAAQQAHLAAVQAQAALALAAQQQQQQLAGERIAAAAKLRALDAAVSQATQQMQALRAQKYQAEAARDRAAAVLRPMLPLIERLALYPSETLLAAPNDTTDSLRSLMAARGLSRVLGADAAALQEKQGQLDAVAAALRNQAATLAAARTAQAAASVNLDAQITAANQAAAAAGLAAKQEQALAQQAGDKATRLRGLIAALTARRLAAAQAAAQDEAQRRQAAAGLAAQIAAAPNIRLGKNTLLVPVAGKLVRDFGADTGAGPATGLTYQAAPNARVIAPCSGTVVFADTFRSFGPMIILDCGNAVHFVLAGLAKLNVQVGRSLRAGEPVGTMPDWNDTTADRPALYLELRRGGQPINPTPYLAPAG